jgi:hypothetical protein
MNQNLARFLGAVGSNIKQNGQIVQTPEEARKSLPGLVNNLQSAVVEYLRRVALLADGMANYNSCNLAQVVSATVINNALAMLSARTAQLEAMSESARLQVLRQTVLEVLGVQAVVTSFGSFPGLSSVTSLTGNLKAFADVARPATPAQVKVNLTSGLSLVQGELSGDSTNILDVWVDGAATAGPPSMEMYLPGSILPQIEFTVAGPYTLAGGTDGLQFETSDKYGPGSTITAPLTHGSRTAAQVATDLDGSLHASGYTAETFFLPLMYQGEVITDATNKVSLPFGNFPGGNVAPGDEVDFYFGVNAIQTRTVTSVHTAGGAIDYFHVDGAALTASSSNRIRTGNKRSVRIIPLDKRVSINDRKRIQLKLPTALEQNTAALFGLYGEVFGQGQATVPDVVATQVTGGSSVCQASTTQLGAYAGTITSDTSDPTVIYTTSSSGIDIDCSVIIPDGPNAGKYFIDAVVVGGQYKLRSSLPVYSDGFNQPVVMHGTIGFDAYIISSKNKTTSTALALNGPASLGFYTGILGPNVGQTFYVQFDSGYKGVNEGDVLEVYLTSTTVPDITTNVVQVYPDGVLRLDVAAPTTLSVPMVEGAAPFAKLVTGHVSDFETLATALTTQLQLPDANPTAYFKDLNRFINPLLVNMNPTDADISSAENRLLDLMNVLEPMDAAIALYNPDHVPQLDEMVKTLKEKGVDRGVDLLLSCEFGVFFGLTQELSSYAGAFQAAVRDVARNDMVVHKADRITSSRLISSSASPNMEYSNSDLDVSPLVDPPVSIDQGAV